jgi:hypothetical protein
MNFKLRKLVFVAVSIACLYPAASHAQDVKVLDHTFSFHGFVTQGGIYTSGNNWLTMDTNSGSGAFTEMGLNVSTKLSDKFHVSAQIYDHNIGQLGQWHPQLDFATLDYRFKRWLSFRGGKVKTTLGLFTDSQDLDFVHPFALMPQSIYPIDLRDATIAHAGGDIYGTISLGRKRGSLSYTAWGGRRYDSIYSGYPYFLQSRGTVTLSYGGPQYGGDLRWNTPLAGLFLGASRMNQYITGTGTRAGLPNGEHSKQDWTNDFYGEYSRGNFTLDAEYRRYLRDEIIRNGAGEDLGDFRGWYFAGSYRFTKWFQLGAYYSHFTVTSTFLNITDTSQPNGHDYDKVITDRFDINRFWSVKVECHFMDGYAAGPFPNGFYPQQNPSYADNTKALVLLTNFNF